MRHAKSDYPAGVADLDRPLNDRGRRDAAAAGQWLAEHWASIVRGRVEVLVSSATRAQQTWALAGEGCPATVRTEPRVYEAAVTTILDLVAASGASTVMVVGHNPTLEDCMHHLAGAGSVMATAVMKTCAIAVLDLDQQGPWSSGSAAPVMFETLRAEPPSA